MRKICVAQRTSNCTCHVPRARSDIQLPWSSPMATADLDQDQDTTQDPRQHRLSRTANGTERHNLLTNVEQGAERKRNDNNTDSTTTTCKCMYEYERNETDTRRLRRPQREDGYRQQYDARQHPAEARHGDYDNKKTEPSLPVNTRDNNTHDQQSAISNQQSAVRPKTRAQIPMTIAKQSSSVKACSKCQQQRAENQTTQRDGSDLRRHADKNDDRPPKDDDTNETMTRPGRRW
jgi:hypothetical protein